MRIHHLDCAPVRPYFPPVASSTVCTLVRAEGELILIDTGFGTQDFAAPSLKMRLFSALMRSRRDPAQTARNWTRSHRPCAAPTSAACDGWRRNTRARPRWFPRTGRRGLAERGPNRSTPNRFKALSAPSDLEAAHHCPAAAGMASGARCCCNATLMPSRHSPSHNEAAR
jgi:hypothetical protein